MVNFNAETTAEQVTDALASHIRGKNVIITGVTKGGLGAEAARVIAKYASLIVIAGRSQEKLDLLRSELKLASPKASIRTLLLDLASLAAVRKAAAEVNAYTEPIHVLINNAGVMACDYSLTRDGYETQLATNHLGPFLFTSLIFPKLLSSVSSPSSAPCRIVNISSSFHRRPPSVGGIAYWEDLNYSNGKTYNRWDGYTRTKIANILFSNEIARRAEEHRLPVLAFSLHPGRIHTDLQSNAPLEEWVKLGVRAPSGEWLVPFKTLEEGTATHIVAAFDPRLATQNGAYLEDCVVMQPAAHASSEFEETRRIANELWTLSEKIVREKFPVLSLHSR